MSKGAFSMEKHKNIVDHFKKGFVAEKKITGIDIKNKIYSKKNNVFKIKITFDHKKSSSFVLKEYTGEEKYQKNGNEIFFYDLLRNSHLNIPSIFYKDPSVLVMEFIGDQTLLSHIGIQEQCKNNNPVPSGRPHPVQKNSSPLWDACMFVNNFHKILKQRTGRSYILGDMNLRNFLPRGKQIYRVDFEDCREGEPEQDFGKFIAFLLNYSPAYTPWKLAQSQRLKSLFKKSWGLNLAKIDAEIQKEQAYMAHRRR